MHIYQWLESRDRKFLIGFLITLLVVGWYLHVGRDLWSTDFERGGREPMGALARGLDVLHWTAVLLVGSVVLFWVYRRFSFPRVFIYLQLFIVAAWFVFYGFVPYNLIVEFAGWKSSYHDSVQLRNVSSSTIHEYSFGAIDPGDTSNMGGDFGDPPNSPNKITFRWWYGKSLRPPTDQSKIYSKTLVAHRTRNYREIQVDISDNGEAKITVLSVVDPFPVPMPSKDSDYWKQKDREYQKIETKRQELLEDWKRD